MPLSSTLLHLMLHLFLLRIPHENCANDRHKGCQHSCPGSIQASCKKPEHSGDKYYDTYWMHLIAFFVGSDNVPDEASQCYQQADSGYLPRWGPNAYDCNKTS